MLITQLIYLSIVVMRYVKHAIYELEGNTQLLKYRYTVRNGDYYYVESSCVIHLNYGGGG